MIIVTCLRGTKGLGETTFRGYFKALRTLNGERLPFQLKSK